MPYICGLHSTLLVSSEFVCKRNRLLLRGMSCQQGDSSLDAAAIRSIWEDGYSPLKSYGSLPTSRMSFANSHATQRNSSGTAVSAASERRSSTTFGAVGSPLRKKSLGAYDCSSGPFMSNLNTSGCCVNESGSTPKRSPVPSMWDYSSG